LGGFGCVIGFAVAIDLPKEGEGFGGVAGAAALGDGPAVAVDGDF
jgi:hypothetical protein